MPFTVDPVTGCHLWTGAVSGRGGYPVVERSGKRYSVTRLECEFENGPPPGDKPYALHACDTPRCINGKHLRWGSRDDNVQDAHDRRRYRGPKGERHRSCKLTEREVLEIRASKEPGVTLAKRYKVTPPVICNIRAGRKWPWLRPSDVVK